MTATSKHRLAFSLVLFASLLGISSGASRANTTFPQTGATVWGPFEAYWKANGGLAQFGLPRTGVFPSDGAYDAQWFERALFTYSPNNADPYKVQLQLLGTLLTEKRRGEEPFKRASASGVGRYFPVTGHTLSGKLLQYWTAKGGLPIFGYPISEPFAERSKSDGKQYTVQYFERNRLESHPELAGTPYETQLGLLGSELLDARGGAAAFANLGSPHSYPPASSGGATATPTPGVSNTPPTAPSLPPASGNVRFQTDFATSDLSAWRQLAPLGSPDAVAATWRVISGRLMQTGHSTDEGSDDSAVIVTRNSSFADFTMDTYFYPGSGESVGAVFRFSDAGFYLLRLYPGGSGGNSPKADLYKYKEGHGTQVAASNSWPGYAYSAWQRLSLVAVGEDLQVAVDGRPVLRGKDPSFKSGGIGLFAHADGTASFDNVRITSQLAP